MKTYDLEELKKKNISVTNMDDMDYDIIKYNS